MSDLRLNLVCVCVCARARRRRPPEPQCKTKVTNKTIAKDTEWARFVGAPSSSLRVCECINTAAAAAACV